MHDVSASNEFAAARFASMSDDDLHRVVTLERDDYVPQVLELADAEFGRRTQKGYRDNAESSDSEDVPALARRSPRMVWADVWAGLIAVQAVAQFPAAILFDVGREGIARSFFFGCFVLAVAIGIRKRRYWGWWGNWMILLIAPARSLETGSAWVVLTSVALMAANGYYFVKHRALFEIRERQSDESP